MPWLKGDVMERVSILNYAYEPMYFVNWQEAVGDIYSGRAEIVEEHDSLRIGVMDGNVISSIPFPKVVRFKTGVPSAKLFERKRTKFNRKDLYIRDNGTCQYCQVKLQEGHWQMDHVFPSSKGGETCWENCVVSCPSCNSKKGNKLLSDTNMTLLNPPTVPKAKPAMASRKN
jgi:5-methylcytosine-specific restriction endonuclease McrA